MNFSLWPLCCQLTCIFGSAAGSFAVVLLLLTAWQLHWYQEKVLSLSAEELETFYINRMDVMLLEEKQLVELYFKKHIANVSLLSSLFAEMLTQTPVTTSEPVWSDQEELELSYEVGAFFTKNEELSPEGTAVIEKVVAMNAFWKHMFNRKLDVAFYGGFNEDDLIFFYPQEYFKENYTPYSRIWFYNANNTSGDVYITDPYIDAGSKELVIITFSKAILVDGAVVGVAAVDVSFTAVNEIFSSKGFGDSGFELLVSVNGIVMGSPPSWNTEDPVFKIDDLSKTGISHEQWTELSVADTDGELRSFIDASGDKFLFKKLSVTPLAGNSPTHFVFVCASQSELDSQVQDFRRGLETTHGLVFYMLAMTISALILITLLLLWLATRKDIKTMVGFTKLTRELILHADQAPMMPTSMIGELNDGDLHAALKDRVDAIQRHEERFAGYNWKGVRPPDITLFDSWRIRLHPKNGFYLNNIDWDKALARQAHSY